MIAPSFIIDEANNPYSMSQEQRDTFDNLVRLLDNLQAIEARSRAVIAAGRPHEGRFGKFSDRVGQWICDCPKCAAWDALAELLTTK